MDNENMPPYETNNQPGVAPAPAPAPATTGYVPVWPEGGNYPPMTAEAVGDVPPIPKKKKKTALFVILAAVILLAAAGTAAFMLLRTPATDLNNPLPLLYEKDGEVFLGNDENVISLGEAHFILSGKEVRLSAMNSFDNTLMIYITDADPETGRGTLMQVRTDGKSQPEKIAEDVAAAKLSRDGTQVLYLTGNADEEDASVKGDLYHVLPGEDAELISEDVHADYFGFSPGGDSFYYLTMEGEYKPFMLYTKTGAEQSVQVHFVERGNTFPYWQIELNDSGEIYIEVWNTDSRKVDLYRGQGAEAECIAEGARIVHIFGYMDGLLYSSDDALYYKAPDEDAELITDSYVDIAFPDYAGSDINYVPEKHFVYAESDGEDTVTLYEQTIGEDPIKITKADDKEFAIQSGFAWMTCVKDGERCLYQRSEDDWSKEAELGENVIAWNFNFADPQTFYYIQSNDADEEYGDAYCYSFEDGSTTKIGRDIIDLIMGAEIYALQDDNTLYRYVKGDLEKVAEDVSETHEAPHGLYVVYGKDKLSIDFYESGKTEPVRIEKNIGRFALAAQSVSYNMPLTQDQLLALEQLHHDAAILVDFSSGFSASDLNNSLLESTLLALSHYKPGEYTQNVSDMFMYYFIGFTDLYGYASDDPTKEDYLSLGLINLMYAEDMYATYMSLND